MVNAGECLTPFDRLLLGCLRTNSGEFHNIIEWSEIINKMYSFPMRPYVPTPRMMKKSFKRLLALPMRSLPIHYTRNAKTFQFEYKYGDKSV